MEYIKDGIIDIEELDASIKLKRLKRRLILATGIIVLFVIAIGIIVFQGNKIAKMDARIKELTNQPAIAEAVTPEISLDVINTELKEIGELSTMEYLYTNAAKFSDSKQIKEWNIPFTEKSFVIKWDGTIKAGIDVDQLYTKVDAWNKILTVCIPQAEILSHDTNEDSVEILDESNGLFNSISVEDKIKFDAETVKEMEERAICAGLLEKAQSNAEEAILKLLKANPDIDNNYSIEFEIIEE